MRHYSEKIKINPRILLEKPVFKGTRILLYVVLDLLVEGIPVKKIIKFYPAITEEDIRAVLLFASDTV